MNTEYIGGVATSWDAGSDTEWAYELALNFLQAALGDPPAGVTINVVWQDHDLGSYPSLAVQWNEGESEPWQFVRRAEHAVTSFNGAIDWSAIRPSDFWSDESADDAEDSGL